MSGFSSWEGTGVPTREGEIGTVSYEIVVKIFCTKVHTCRYNVNMFLQVSSLTWSISNLKKVLVKLLNVFM